MQPKKTIQKPTNNFTPPKTNMTLAKSCHLRLVCLKLHGCFYVPFHSQPANFESLEEQQSSLALEIEGRRKRWLRFYQKRLKLNLRHLHVKDLKTSSPFFPVYTVLPLTSFTSTRKINMATQRPKGSIFLRMPWHAQPPLQIRAFMCK